MSSIDSEVARRVEKFVAELTALVRQSALGAVTKAFNDVHRAPSGSPGRGEWQATRTSSARRSPGAKRSPRQISRMVAAILAYVKAHPGQRIEQIGKALKRPTKDLALPARKLVAAKKLRTKGQKRATTYLPV